MREAEGIVCGTIPLCVVRSARQLTYFHVDHGGIANDLFSYAKEKLTDSDETNIMRILQDKEGLSYTQARDVVEELLRQKERDFVSAGLAVLQHPDLGLNDPEVRRWIASLQYCMGGLVAWSQEVSSLNVPVTRCSPEAITSLDDTILEMSQEASRFHHCPMRLKKRHMKN